MVFLWVSLFNNPKKAPLWLAISPHRQVLAELRRRQAAAEQEAWEGAHVCGGVLVDTYLFWVG